MESIKKYKFISLVTVYFLIVVVTSCGEGDDFGDLEEKSVFEPIKEISDNNSESPTDLPIITKISDSSITQFSTFSVDVDNENKLKLFNSDSQDIGMIYSCFFYPSQSNEVDPDSEYVTPCSKLPSNPSASFNVDEGKLIWTPSHDSIKKYHFKITGENEFGKDSTLFLVDVIEDNAPLLTHILDTVVLPNIVFTVDINNEKSGDDNLMTYTCSFDTIVDDDVSNGENCNGLPGDSDIKFYAKTGLLLWTPTNEEGRYEIEIVGTKVSDFGSGEDTEVFVVTVGGSDQKNVILTTILDTVITQNYALAVDVNNEISGDDKNMIYNCYYDTNPNGVGESTGSCNDLPGSPAVKFNKISGSFSWTPDTNALGKFEIQIIGEKEGNFDEELFVIDGTKSEDEAIRLTVVRDQTGESGKQIFIDVNNEVTGDDSEVTYSCYVDTVIDGSVGSKSLPCDNLPGSPAIKFSPTNGSLVWTPNDSAEGEYEVKIIGEKSEALDAELFVVSFIESSFGKIGNSAISFTPTSHNFGYLLVDTESEVKEVTLQNSSSKKIYISSISEDSEHFTMLYTTCSYLDALESQASCKVGIKFNPKTNAELGTSLLVRFGATVDNKIEFNSAFSLTGQGFSSLEFNGLNNISSITHNSMKLNWDLTPDAEIFMIFRVVGDAMIFEESIENTGGTVVNHTITGLSPSTDYSFRVRATDVSGT